ncbi:hypothetical protein E7811_10380 [Aliigemmobacter aestuarii]|uniref:Mannose-6-phosphate isomerase type II C-terminal domain-containing protein n=1 Tax=Aliigemmobacter aestuarii TaxID=1445661 RepID=A0A4S3MN17_9RHOB|nr:hypothetical protein [Gemmobacter aestuarii]THD83667.1 hypothetical protein E7811_10380 [Gemmobacter aestuarii]
MATRDSVLICDMNHAQSTGEAAKQIQRAGITQAESFLRRSRPWAHDETLSPGPRLQVKAIMVAPGGRLSQQSHVHRAEHWGVVEGTAPVQVGRDEPRIAENEPVCIPWEGCIA